MAGNHELPADGRAVLYHGHIIWLTRERERGGWRYGVWRLASVTDGFVEDGSALRVAGPFDTADGAYQDARRCVAELASTHATMRRMGRVASRAALWFGQWARATLRSGLAHLATHR